MKTLNITTKKPLINKEQGYVEMELDYGPALYRGKIKIRGNSTALGYKKPYTIKLDTTAHLLDGEDDKYILLANCYDPTQMRNYLALNMARELGIDYTPQTKYVEVYINGEHKGLYLLVDSVMDKVKGDFLIETEQWDNPDLNVKYAISNSGRKYKIHFDKNGYDIVSLLNKMEDIINNGGNISLNEGIKVKSFAKYYILQEFFKNADVGVASTIYYGKKDKIRACCPWDFDLSSGNYKPDFYPALYIDGDSAKGLYATKMYPENIFNIPEFKREISETYLNIIPWIEDIHNKMSWIYVTYKDSFDNDVIDQGMRYCEYQYEPLGTLKANMDFLQDWLTRRHEYLQTELLNENK